jgi:hypothetical protein
MITRTEQNPRRDRPGPAAAGIGTPVRHLRVAVAARFHDPEELRRRIDAARLRQVLGPGR